MLKLISALVLIVMPILSVSTSSTNDKEVFQSHDIWTQCGPGGCEGDEEPPAPLVDTTPTRAARQ